MGVRVRCELVEQHAGVDDRRLQRQSSSRGSRRRQPDRQREGRGNLLCQPYDDQLQVPAEVPDGWWPVVVTNNGAATGAVLAGVTRNAAAAFLNFQNGVRYAVATQRTGR